MTLGKKVVALLLGAPLALWIWLFLPAGTVPKAWFDDRWDRLPSDKSAVAELITGEFNYFCFFSAYAFGPAPEYRHLRSYNEYVSDPTSGTSLAQVITNQFSDRFPIYEGPAYLFLFDNTQQLTAAYEIHQGRGHLRWTPRYITTDVHDFCADRQNIELYVSEEDGLEYLRFRNTASQ